MDVRGQAHADRRSMLRDTSARLPSRDLAPGWLAPDWTSLSEFEDDLVPRCGARYPATGDTLLQTRHSGFGSKVHCSEHSWTLALEHSLGPVYELQPRSPRAPVSLPR